MHNSMFRDWISVLVCVVVMFTKLTGGAEIALT